jgi:hypothetical protein
MWVVKIANSAHVQSAAIGYMCMWHNCSKMYESLIDLEKHLNEHIELSIQLFRQSIANIK